LRRQRQGRPTAGRTGSLREREFFIDNLLVRIHFIIVMIRWTGLALGEFEFPFPGSLTSTFLDTHTRPALGSSAPRTRPGRTGTSRVSEAGSYVRLIDLCIIHL